MKQPIAGVSPRQLGEVTVMTVWPSMASTPIGRFLGRLYCNQSPLSLGLGKLWAVATIPLVVAIFFARLLPPFPFSWPYRRRFRLTNRRLVELGDVLSWKLYGGLIPVPRISTQELRQVRLTQFDGIRVEVQPGQQWYPAGDLVFSLGKTETFRAEGILRPETFRATCLKSQQSCVGVEQVLERQLA